MTWAHRRESIRERDWRPTDLLWFHGSRPVGWAWATRAAGAVTGVVYCEPRGAARAVYESVGFQPVATRYRWR
jgi:hypothetical protein